MEAKVDKKSDENPPKKCQKNAIFHPLARIAVLKPQFRPANQAFNSGPQGGHPIQDGNNETLYLETFCEIRKKWLKLPISVLQSVYCPQQHLAAALEPVQWLPLQCIWLAREKDHTVLSFTTFAQLSRPWSIG